MSATTAAASDENSKKKLISRRKLAVELKCHVSTVDRLKRGRAIPFVRKGRLIRFDLDDVVDALKRNFGVRAIGDIQ